MEVGIWTIVGVLIAGFGLFWYRLGKIEGRLQGLEKRLDGLEKRVEQGLKRINDELRELRLPRRMNEAPR